MNCTKNILCPFDVNVLFPFNENQNLNFPKIKSNFFILYVFFTNLENRTHSPITILKRTPTQTVTGYANYWMFKRKKS